MVLVSDQMTSMYPQAILHTFGYIYQIDVQSLFDIHSSNYRPLTSLSQITVRFKGTFVFSNRHLFQILRSMADLLLSNRRPFQNKELYVLLSCHMMDVGQVCKASFLT